MWYCGVVWEWGGGGDTHTKQQYRQGEMLSQSLTDLSWSALRKRGRIMWRKLLLRSSLGWLLALLIEPFNLLLRKLWSRLEEEEESSSRGKQMKAREDKGGVEFQRKKEVEGVNCVWFDSVMGTVRRSISEKIKDGGVWRKHIMEGGRQSKNKEEGIVNTYVHFAFFNSMLSVTNDHQLC